jgi:hypothetical protein
LKKNSLPDIYSPLTSGSFLLLRIKPHHAWLMGMCATNKPSWHTFVYPISEMIDLAFGEAITRTSENLLTKACNVLLWQWSS